MNQIKNIVIVGAGFAGIKAALTLEKRLGASTGWRIVLIDKQNFHLYTPLLYEAATAFFEKETSASERLLKKGVCLNFREIKEIIGQRQIKFMRREVVKIDTGRQKIYFKGAPTLDYHYLILATGSRTEYFDIPGLRENSVGLKTIDEALKIRQEVINLSRQNRPIRVVIGGGGFTGVELACELVGFFKKLNFKSGLNPRRISLMILEACDQLIPGISKKLSQEVLGRLKDLGIDINLNTKIKSVSGKKIELEDGQSLIVDLLIWTGGVKGTNLSITAAKDTKDRLLINEYLQLINHETAFAIGDIACIKNNPLPSLASIALQQAKNVAENIFNSIHGYPLQKFKPRYLGFVVPLGGKFALANFNEYGNFIGMIGYMFRRLIDLEYFLTIMPIIKAVNIWWHGAIVYRNND